MKKHTIGDVITVDMHKSEVKDKKFPIARTATGMICFIMAGIKGYFEYNSTWVAEVVEVRAKTLIIEPLECITSAAANKFEFEKKLELLKTKGKPF